MALSRMNSRQIFILAAISTVALFVLYGRSHGSTASWHSLSSTSLQANSDGSLENIQNSTLGFQKIFVISLAARYDKRDAMSLAAAVSGLDIEYVDGVLDVDTKYLPYGGHDQNYNVKSLLALRAHANVLRTIVEQNITSALILEDDIDWDIRIKSQMRDFALASRLIVQPESGTEDHYIDPTYPRPSADQVHADFSIHNVLTKEPTTSPYGDLNNWDLLWVGHCGARFPGVDDISPPYKYNHTNSPLARVVIPNDVTVPERRHLNMELGDQQLLMDYADHTRVVSRARVTSCSLAYAVSQPGARKFLYETSVHKMTTHAYDILLQYACDGVDGRRSRICLLVQPQLFQHHRPRGSRRAQSDIDDYGEGENEVASTINVRWSTRLNMGKLVDGETDYVDQYPDAEGAP